MPRITEDVLDRVTRRGTRLSRRGFTLYYLRLLNPPRPRVVISQKVDKRATARNLLRRRILSLLRQPRLANRAVVVIVRKELITLSFTELKTEFSHIISQIQ